MAPVAVDAKQLKVKKEEWEGKQGLCVISVRWNATLQLKEGKKCVMAEKSRIRKSKRDGILQQEQLRYEHALS